jgi:hypothetical protein
MQQEITVHMVCNVVVIDEVTCTVGYWFAAFIVFLVAAKANLSIIIKNDSSSLMWMASTCAGTSTS